MIFTEDILDAASGGHDLGPDVTNGHHLASDDSATRSTHLLLPLPFLKVLRS